MQDSPGTLPMVDANGSPHAQFRTLAPSRRLAASNGSHVAINDFVRILRRSDLGRSLSDGELRYIAEAARVVTFRSDETICRQDDPGDRMFIITKGRVKVSIEHGGAFRLLEYLGSGDHFGEMSLLTDAPRSATVVAVMDTQLLELDLAQFDKLMTAVPGFAANLSRSLGYRLRLQNGGGRRRRKPAVVGLVHGSPQTRQLVQPLAAALLEAGDSLEILTDRADLLPGNGYLVERIPPHGGSRTVEAVHDRLTQVIVHHDRVLVELEQTRGGDELSGLLAQCEEIWWLAESRDAEPALKRLRSLIERFPKLAQRIHLVWILDESERYAPPQPEPLGIASPDFKIVLSADPARPDRHQQQGIARLVRHLQGTQIGLALGGGGARGLAHLGVLRALEREGIFFDMVAGTSVGALMGLAYCGGWSPDEALRHFQEDLTPPRWVRSIPGGNHWYMLAKFRLGSWDGMLRKYFGQCRLEQLRVPLSTVAVDLVSGEQVVRDRGDAVHSVLESINLPMISRPILRDGMALVDGGVLNVLPADVVHDRGADLVVGINVVSKLPRKFAGNDSTTPHEKMRMPGPIETMLRINEVQDHGITALRTGVVDLMISPDMSAFEFADFASATAMAEVGEAAAVAMIPQLKRIVRDLAKSA